ncbi:DUF4124 domain-containing protein [Variovorax sp. J22P271]|uniref:DUF4124 domain-containing protein n=1 Tax=Variovorax davisae TaxID=3053515 RepID=UPI00257496F9|nr:DUF4124 domain-containing protein [Variovorax sp. J22P271]MDM0035722.1 DUF4124 domain-containing protein [Variovorax sp. J22P271]
MDPEICGALMKSIGERAAALACCVLVSLSSAESDAQSPPRVYACKDAHGRTLTSDRPIADCADRNQQELRKTGGVLRTVGPTYSDRDLVARQNQAQRAEQAALDRAGERRRERALLVRYPDVRIHDRERDEALAQIEQAAQVAKHYLATLKVDRQGLDQELEFYRGDRTKAPAALREKFEENEAGFRAQSKFIQSMEEDRQRLALRFAKERTQLEPLWQAVAAKR